MNDVVYKTTYAVGNDADDEFVTPAPAYTGEHTPASGHTVESERGWNSWWQANLDIAMEHNIVPAVGDAMGMIWKELGDEIKGLHDRVAKPERELEQARADSIVTLPRSAWRHNAA